MTAFTSPFDVDVIYLWAPRTQQKGLMDQITKIFMPFTLELWLMILGVTLVMSLVEVWRILF